MMPAGRRPHTGRDWIADLDASAERYNRARDAYARDRQAHDELLARLRAKLVAARIVWAAGSVLVLVANLWSIAAGTYNRGDALCTGIVLGVGVMVVTYWRILR